MWSQLGGLKRSARCICAALAFLLLVVASPAHADCPLSCMGYICSSRASADTAISVTFCYFESGYNIPAGTLFAHINGGPNDCWTGGEAKIEDDFVVDGLPTGTPVSLSARLDYSASWWCGNCVGFSGVSAKITQGVNTATWNAPTCDPSSPDCSHSLNTALVLPIQATVGTPFRASFEVWGEAGEAFAGMDGAISFDNLPAHAVIHSCNGFVQGQVPTLPTTWGRVKSLYR